MTEAPSPPSSIALAVVVYAPGGVAMPVPFVIAEAGERMRHGSPGDNSLRVSFGGTAAPA